MMSFLKLKTWLFIYKYSQLGQKDTEIGAAYRRRTGLIIITFLAVGLEDCSLTSLYNRDARWWRQKRDARYCYRSVGPAILSSGGKFLCFYQHQYQLKGLVSWKSLFEEIVKKVFNLFGQWAFEFSLFHKLVPLYLGHDPKLLMRFQWHKKCQHHHRLRCPHISVVKEAPWHASIVTGQTSVCTLNAPTDINWSARKESNLLPMRVNRFTACRSPLSHRAEFWIETEWNLLVGICFLHSWYLNIQIQHSLLHIL